jgi:putative thioredoxin
MADADRFRGALDLSMLAQPSTSNPGEQQGSAFQSQNASEGEVSRVVKVANLILEGDQQQLRGILAISNSVPVIIDFYSIRSENSVALSPKLAQLIIELAGRMLLVRIDFDAHPQIAQAFQVASAPTVVALLGGQPVPLINSDAPIDQIAPVFNQILKVAAENGLTGTLEVSSEVPTDPDKALFDSMPPAHQAAYEAISSGNYQLAIDIYKETLKQNPGDVMATKGLAQVELLSRTENLDFEQLLSKPASDLPTILLQADALVALGEFERGFAVLLDAFAVQFENREEIRKHLIELFVVAGEDPSVSSARSRLATLLY